jgi:hypothetical protein
MRIRRTHGIFGGFLVAVLGIWGGIIPFVGPYFHYAYTPDIAWHYTTGRLYLEILPGAGALLGGMIMMWAGSRHAALFGSLVAIASGAWFALGNVFAPLWTVANPAGGPASSGLDMRILEQIGFFSGLGIVIVLLAAVVAGRVTAVRGVPVVTPTGRTAVVPVTRERGVTREQEPVVPATREPVDENETEVIS